MGVGMAQQGRNEVRNGRKRMESNKTNAMKIVSRAKNEINSDG